MADVDGSSLPADSGWLGLGSAAAWHLGCIHQMNWVNSGN